MTTNQKQTKDAKPSNVIEALAAVMADLPGIGKDSKADPRQGGYAYRGIEAITREVQPLLAKYGVVFVPRVVSHEIREIIVNEKPWTDTIALVEFDVFGPGGIEDKITVGPILSMGRDNSDKGGNKCLTQALKYALTQTLCISDAKDDADAASHEADAKPVDAEAERLSKVIVDAINSGKITAQQAADAAKKHGVQNKAQMLQASAGVVASIIETLGLEDKAPDRPLEAVK